MRPVPVAVWVDFNLHFIGTGQYNIALVSRSNLASLAKLLSTTHGEIQILNFPPPLLWHDPCRRLFLSLHWRANFGTARHHVLIGLVELLQVCGVADCFDDDMTLLWNRLKFIASSGLWSKMLRGSFVILYSWHLTSTKSMHSIRTSFRCSFLSSSGYQCDLCQVVNTHVDVYETWAKITCGHGSGVCHNITSSTALG